MTKFNKIMTVLFCVAIILGVASIGVSAATGENVITIINEIFENHIYKVNDIEVSEDEYNAALTAEGETVVIDVEHKLYTEVVYKINGEVVSADVYNARLAAATQQENSQISAPPAPKAAENTSTIKVEAMDIEAVAMLSSYVDFDDSISNDEFYVSGATVKSDKVVEIIYEYSDNYMSFTDNGYFTADFNGIIYRDITADGYVFTVGQPSVSNYYVADSDGICAVDAVVGQNVFSFVKNPTFSRVNFSDVFKSVTFVIKN